MVESTALLPSCGTSITADSSDVLLEAVTVGPLLYKLPDGSLPSSQELATISCPDLMNRVKPLHLAFPDSF
jgi:hypothetical protein